MCMIRRDLLKTAAAATIAGGLALSVGQVHPARGVLAGIGLPEGRYRRNSGLLRDVLWRPPRLAADKWRLWLL
jgi:hypothetical protein